MGFGMSRGVRKGVVREKDGKGKQGERGCVFKKVHGVVRS